MTPDERQQAIKKIAAIEADLERIYRGFSRLRRMTELNTTSNCFIDLTLSIGQLINDRLTVATQLTQLIAKSRDDV